MLAQLQNVNKTYQSTARAVAALAEMTLRLDAGQFVAVCGPSGCGKSTLLLTLGGLLRPDTGQVLIDDQDLYALPANRRARFRARNIGFVFQQFHLIPYLSVLDNVLTARLGLDDPQHDAARQRAERLIDQLGLSERAQHRPGQLSTGERQRTALARALLNQPRLLLADEPTGNLDPANAQVVLGHLEQFARQGGAVLLVTHDGQAAERADRILRLDRGRMVA
jgi:ABC-type lipoprotein export system ATPase subunit